MFRKFNKELQEELGLAPVTSYIWGQRLQWFGHKPYHEKKQKRNHQSSYRMETEEEEEASRQTEEEVDIVKENLRAERV